MKRIEIQQEKIDTLGERVCLNKTLFTSQYGNESTLLISRIDEASVKIDLSQLRLC